MKKIRIKHIIYGGTIFFAATLFVAFGPPDLIEKTSDPEYCNTCHVMNHEYDAWFYTGLHRNIKCVDCHLPNNNGINYLLWKGLDGMKDLIMFHTRSYSEPIGITEHGKKVIKGNCVRCHSEMVSRINVERNCWDCHRRVNHTVAAFSGK